MKISLLTVSFNSAATIGDTIRSVQEQHHNNLEYIVVDGQSKDSTVEIIRGAGSVVTRLISEPDQGIYDAMNKAIGMATGDVVGIINSDDFYASPQILSSVADAFSDPSVDAVFGDLVVVDPENLGKVVRRYSSARWNPERFAWGFMPAHPTFFVRRIFYDEIGLFKTDYRIAADYELLIRFLFVHRLRYRYLPLTMVHMRRGGVSSRGLRSNVILNQEILRACRENGIYSNGLMVYSKYFRKLWELI